MKEIEQHNRLERPRSKKLDKILGHDFPVLDHGFIRVIDYMGDDSAIVQAARVSYGTGTKSTREDESLVKYLMSHRHTTPFEMCELKVHVKLPIFVARQWVRHRTANINEYSARYSILDEEFFVPDVGQLQPQSSVNMQGREGELSMQRAEDIRELITDEASRDYAIYKRLLGEDGEQGIARELARIGLGLNFYTQWYWKIDLHNLLNFLQLRADPHAQAEIRAYAEVLLDIVRRWVPAAYEAFQEYRAGSVTLSRTSFEMVRALLRGEDVQHLRSRLGRREKAEFEKLFGVGQKTGDENKSAARNVT